MSSESGPGKSAPNERIQRIREYIKKRDGVTEQQRATHAARPWWKKKRWWLGAFLVWYIAMYFVPYSLNGPAPACMSWDLRGPRDQIRDHSIEVKGNFDLVDVYILNGLYKKNTEKISQNGYNIMKKNDIHTVKYHPKFSLYCFPGNLILYGGTITLDVIPLEAEKWLVQDVR